LNNEIDFDDETACSEELHQQKSSKENMKKFHKALKFQIYQCCVCHEAWPLKTNPKILSITFVLVVRMTRMFQRNWQPKTV